MYHTKYGSAPHVGELIWTGKNIKSPSTRIDKFDAAGVRDDE